MNIQALCNSNNMYETCILCRTGVDTGQRYYVRTDVKAAITDLLLKIPRNLAHLFDFLPSISTSSVGLPFCCRSCKRLVEKRQKLVENIDVVEKEMRSRRFGQAARSLELGVESSSTSHANPSATCTSSPVPTSGGNQFYCELSPIATPRPTTCTSLDSHLSLEALGSAKPNKELGVKV